MLGYYYILTIIFYCRLNNCILQTHLLYSKRLWFTEKLLGHKNMHLDYSNPLIINYYMTPYHNYKHHLQKMLNLMRQMLNPRRQMKLDPPKQKLNQLKNLYCPKLIKCQIKPIKLKQQQLRPMLLNQICLQIGKQITQPLVLLLKQLLLQMQHRFNLVSYRYCRLKVVLDKLYFASFQIKYKWIHFNLSGLPSLLESIDHLYLKLQFKYLNSSLLLILAFQLLTQRRQLILKVQLLTEFLREVFKIFLGLRS